MKILRLETLATCLLLATTACAIGGSDDDGLDTDTGELSTTDDDLNGLWTGTLDGQPLPADAVIESWPAVGIRLHVGDAVYALGRSGDTLSGASASLDIEWHKSTVKDDEIVGTVDGHTLELARDIESKPPITLAFPGDRPFRAFLSDLLVPAAQADRESFTKMRSSEVGAFLRSCELYKHGSWQWKYMKGSTWSERNASFGKVIKAIDGLTTTPRRLTKEYRFRHALELNVKDPSLMGLAMSTFSMYFSAGAGRSVHLPITDDSVGYFITDRPARAERIGVVAMDTPLHGPLASTFGRQLLDLGAMPATDDPIYARTVMELLAKSDVHSAAGLSPTGRSALTDWYSVMAIEDYRGVVFGWPDLGWGYNMTNVQFYGLIVRALARPGETDDAGHPVLGQVIVGSELRPGDPSYADVLNHGNDMQEYPDMARLKQLATQYLRANHPDQVAAVEQAFAGIVPKSQLDWRAQNDIFHLICAELYNARSGELRGEAADAAVEAVTQLFATLTAESASFEAYVLAHGVTTSNVAAPQSTGY